MKYYSEILRKTFDTVKELNDAEAAEKEKVLEKQKEEAARTEEIKAAKEAVEKAKEEYEIAFKACREALSRWSAAERELVAVKNRNRSASGYSQTDDDFKRLIEPWGLTDWFFI